MHSAMTCLHCLGLEKMHLRFDKRGRPYTTCLSCGTRAFMTSGLNNTSPGLAILEPYATHLANQIAMDPARAMKANAEIHDFVRRIQDAQRDAAPQAPSPFAPSAWRVA